MRTFDEICNVFRLCSLKCLFACECVLIQMNAHTHMHIHVHVPTKKPFQCLEHVCMCNKMWRRLISIITSRLNNLSKVHSISGFLLLLGATVMLCVCVCTEAQINIYVGVCVCARPVG